MTHIDPSQLFDNWAEGYDPAANLSGSDFPFAGYDRVLAAYVLHHFDLAAKVELLRQVATQSLARGGRTLVADFSFQTEARAPFLMIFFMFNPS